MPIRSALVATCAALLLATAALYAATGRSSGRSQADDVSGEPTLDARIGFPDQGQFKRVCDENDWRNPLIDVTANGRILLRSASNPTFRSIDVADLRRALVDLPVGDWPYGRIIAIPNKAHADANAVAAYVSDVITSVNPLRMSWWGWPHACANGVARSAC